MTRQQSPSDSNNSKSNGRRAASDGARGNLSVREAGRKGGLRVRELIERGRMVEQREKEQRH